jgi:acetyl-CoA acetyltransferase
VVAPSSETKAGWKIGDLDLIEVNEAFAAQATPNSIRE